MKKKGLKRLLKTISAAALIALSLILVTGCSKKEEPVADDIIEENDTDLTEELPEKTLDQEEFVFTGTVTDFAELENDEGYIMLESEEESVRFNYGNETDMQITISDIKEGDMLTVTYNGIMARSYPPQAYALQITEAS